MKSSRVARSLHALALVASLFTLTTPTAGQVNPRPALPPGPFPPAPRLSDGTPNLGTTEPNQGYWHLTQFQDYKQVLVAPTEIPINHGLERSPCSAGLICRSGIRKATACRPQDRV